MSTKLSSDTLFHYTKRFKALLKVLKEGFRPNHSIENFDFLINDNSKSKSNYFIPMVCFCDIPISSTKNHIKKYGRYAIGLSKEWGKINGLNPVMYISENSKVIRNFKFVYNNYNDLMKKIEEEKNELLKLKYEDIDKNTIVNYSEKNGIKITKNNFEKTYSKFVRQCFSEDFLLGYSQSLNDFYNNLLYPDNIVKQRIHKLLLITKIAVKYILYIKPYTNTSETVKYYDEKEWRYVPDIPQEFIQCSTFDENGIPNHKNFNSPIIKRQKELLNRGIKILKFNSSDLRYIIVKDNMKNRLIDFLSKSNLYKKDYYLNQRNIKNNEKL